MLFILTRGTVTEILFRSFQLVALGERTMPLSSSDPRALAKAMRLASSPPVWLRKSESSWAPCPSGSLSRLSSTPTSVDSPAAANHSKRAHPRATVRPKWSKWLLRACQSMRSWVSLSPPHNVWQLRQPPLRADVFRVAEGIVREATCLSITRIGRAHV